MGVAYGDSTEGQANLLRDCETSISIPPQLCTSKNLLSSTIFSFGYSSASISPGGINNIVGRSIKSLEATAKQSDTPCVHHVDIAWLLAVSAAGLFTERWSKRKEGTHQTQPLVSGAGGRDRTGMGLLGPRDFQLVDCVLRCDRRVPPP
jgi:hypothetical protein